jgi:hypothetical protein
VEDPLVGTPPEQAVPTAGKQTKSTSVCAFNPVSNQNKQTSSLTLDQLPTSQPREVTRVCILTQPDVAPLILRQQGNPESNVKKNLQAISLTKRHRLLQKPQKLVNQLELIADEEGSFKGTV